MQSLASLKSFLQLFRAGSLSFLTLSLAGGGGGGGGGAVGEGGRKSQVGKWWLQQTARWRASCSILSSLRAAHPGGCNMKA